MSEKQSVEKDAEVVFIFDGETWRFEVRGPGISGIMRRFPSFDACVQAFKERYAA